MFGQAVGYRFFGHFRGKFGMGCICLDMALIGDRAHLALAPGLFDFLQGHQLRPPWFHIPVDGHRIGADNLAAIDILETLLMVDDDPLAQVNFISNLIALVDDFSEDIQQGRIHPQTDRLLTLVRRHQRQGLTISHKITLLFGRVEALDHHIQHSVSDRRLGTDIQDRFFILVDSGLQHQPGGFKRIAGRIVVRQIQFTALGKCLDFFHYQVDGFFLDG